MTKQGLIDSIVAAAPAGNVDAKLLESKTVDQLRNILGDAIIAMHERHQEQMFEAQADRAVANAVFQMEVAEPRRKAEAAALEKANRRIFEDAAKTLRTFSLNEGNYQLLCDILGEL